MIEEDAAQDGELRERIHSETTPPPKREKSPC